MRKLSFLLIASVLLVLAGCMPSTNGIMQVSTIDALLAGVYEGHMSLQTLRQYGDFGLGTFEALDGEMLLLDGTFYKVRADGTVLTPPLTEETPFAAVTYFVPTHTELIQGPIDMAALESRIDTIVPAANHPVAFRLHGTFSKVVTRSVPAQEEPYPPLAEVTKNQSIFDLTDVTGTLMGFRLPQFVEGVNVPGYHLHFLTDDLEDGGHVLEAEVTAGQLQVDGLSNWLHIYFPMDSAAFGGADLTQDRSQELDQVETQAQGDMGGGQAAGDGK